MNDSKMTPPPGDEPMSVRECRLILERLLVVAGTDPGALAATRDALLDAQVLGAPVLESVHRDPSLLTPSRARTTCHQPGHWTVDGQDQFSLLLLPVMADLLIAGAARGEQAQVHVVAARRTEDLHVLAPLLAARGATLDISFDIAGATLTATRAPADNHKLEVRRTGALRDGFRVRGVVWLDLYQLSNAALVPESSDTRRHAGHEDVDEHGNFIRQMDDDADVEHALRARSAPHSA
jgi:hypothetical protein